LQLAQSANRFADCALSFPRFFLPFSHAAALTQVLAHVKFFMQFR
jgi:hypothetical protein